MKTKLCLEPPAVRRAQFLRACAYIMVFALAGTAGSVLPGLGTFALPPVRAEAGTEPVDLFSNGYFQALHGYYLLEGEKLHVYRALPSVLNPKTHKLELSPEDDELKPLWRGEPYYHESYILDDGEWVPKMWDSSDTRGKREFSQPPTQYLEFGACDEHDRITLPDVKFKRELGRGVKIKDIVKSDGYAAVVYSANPDMPTCLKSPYQPSDRLILASLFARHGEGWDFIRDSRGSCMPRRFCGTRALVTQVGGQSRFVLLVFSIAGEYSELDSYVLYRDKNENFLRKYRQWPESKKP